MLLLKFIIVTVIGIFFYYAVRQIIIRQRSRTFSDSEKKEKTGFVIDTFHTLVLKLKQNEEELERLKKAAEERAEEIESYNDDILRSITTAVISINKERKITTYNQEAEKILGLEREYVIGRSSQEVFGKESTIFNLIENSLTESIVPKREEIELNKKDNNKIRIGISTSLLRNKKDEVIGATLVFTDLTEIRRLQEEIETKKRLSMIGEMSAGIAHEFRNFMGAIFGFSKMLSKKIDKDDPRQEMIRGIMSEIEAMEKLIAELLNFGKETRLSLYPSDLKKIIKEVAAQAIERLKDEPKPIVHLNMPDDLPLITIDEILIRQAISNLVQNGLEAMENGGELRIDLCLPDQALKSEWIEIKIADRGIGIPKDKLEKIFLPFFTTKKKGTGLGLALVHKIIVSHRGRIEVESREGVGTTFRVYLPL